MVVYELLSIGGNLASYKGSSFMENKKRSIQIANDIIGSARYDEAAAFFKAVYNYDCDVIIFVSRKAYLMFKAAEKCGYDLRETEKAVYSDRIILKPYKHMESRFDGKSVLLIDDTVTSGNTIRKHYDRLTDPSNGFKCADVSIYCFATRTDNNISEDIKKVYTTHIKMTGSEITDFSLREAQLVHALGMVYFVELPIYHVDFASKEFFDNVERQVNGLAEGGGWQKEPYAQSDKSLVHVHNSYFLSSAKGELIPSVFPSLFEFVKYSYVKHDPVDGHGEESYSINFVPLKFLYYFDENFALSFMSKLSDVLRNGESLRLYLVELMCESDVEIRFENFSKSVSYILSCCLGLEFFNCLYPGKVELEIKQTRKDASLNEDFIKFVENIRFDDVSTVKDVLNCTKLHRNGINFPRGDKRLERLLASDKLKGLSESFNKSNTFENLSVLLTELMNVTKSEAQESLRKISLRSICDAFDEGLLQPVFRSVVMMMIETSVCSFSHLTYNDDFFYWILMSLTPGENSFIIATYNMLPPKYFNALSMFVFGIGGYNEMKQHLDSFQDECGGMLQANGEPFVDVGRVVRDVLDTEKKFNDCYLERVREDDDGIFSDFDCNSRAYDLGRKYSK